jgi:polysaccharide export outer membrane protein
MEAGCGALAMKGRAGVDVVIALASVLAVTLAPAGGAADAQTGNATPPQAIAKPLPAQSKPPAGAEVPAGVPTAPDYVIGPDDVLTVIVWREKDISGDVAVRPDGKISLPLVNDVQAAGLTPEQLRVQVTEAASKFVEEPNVTVVVKAINSRKIFVTGQVSKPGPYPLLGAMTIMQALSVAGGVAEYADSENISILRMVGGKQESFRFNYKEVSKRKNLKQNIELKPGDTIIVP